MSKGLLIAALEAEGFFVEADTSTVHGVNDAGRHVFGRCIGGERWKLQAERSATRGTICRNADEVAAYLGRSTRPALTSTAEVYHDGAEFFVLEPVTSAAMVTV